MSSNKSTNTNSVSQEQEILIEHIVDWAICKLASADDNNNFSNNENAGATSSSASLTTHQSTMNRMLIEF